jgi:hypothetical protein
MIDVTCPQCGIVYHSDELHIGKQLRCGRCGGHVPILKPEKAVVQQPPATPRNSSTWARRHESNRNPKRRRILFLVAALVSGGLIAALILHYHDKPSTPDKSSNSTNANAAIVDRPTLGTEQSSDATNEPGALRVIGEEPIPRTDHTPKSSARNSVSNGDPRPTQYHSLPNGAHIGDVLCGGGHGKLTVQNGTSEDAVVRLYDNATGETVCWFFVDAKNSAKETQIPQGIYRLAYTTGLDWIESEDTFHWQPSYNKFERILEYNEQRDDEGVQYHDISVTLQPVLGGNVHTKHISREEFLKGHHHISLHH